MNKKLGQLFAGIAIIAAGMGVTLLAKERKEIEMIEEDATDTAPIIERS